MTEAQEQARTREAQAHAENVRLTYLGLRIAMPVLVAMLFSAVAIQALSADPNCLLTSISAYYHSPVRPVFVAVLCAMGVCLIVYRGTTIRDNFFLDIAGFLAVIVAFVPTGRDTHCGEELASSNADASAAIGISVPVLLGAATVALFVGFFVPAARSKPKHARGAIVALGISGVALAAAWVYYFASRPTFEDSENVHGVAAITMFLCMATVAIFNSREADKPWARVGYRIVAGVMALTLAVAVGRHLLDLDWDSWSGVLVLEALLISEFAAFWVIQTLELGGQVRRRDGFT